MGRGKVARPNLQIAWCRYGMGAQAKAARDATFEAALDGGSGGGRNKRSFRPPVPMLGDDGKPLASLQAKANRHQRELMKEFGENCTEFSEAEHLVRVQADKQAVPVLFTRSPTDTCAALGTEREWEDALHVLSKPKSGRGGGTEFAILTRSLFSSWARLGKLSSAVIYVDIRKAFYSVLVEEVVGPVMGRRDRAKVMARLGWTESEQHRLEATLQGRQHETALLGMAPDIAAMLANRHQTNWLTVQGAEKRPLHFTGVRPDDPTADVMCAFAFARFHRKLVDRLRKKGLLPAILLHGGQLDAFADESEETHIEPPAYMDDFFRASRQRHGCGSASTSCSGHAGRHRDCQGARVAVERGFQQD